MSIIIEAACMSNIGRIRSNNEDNLYFDGKIMSISSGAAQKAISLPLNKWICFAVFDGMGGEEDGEVASHTAAETMKNFLDGREDERVDKETFAQLCLDMNSAVCDKSMGLECGRMGTTFVCLGFVEDGLYVCNIGDSRAFALRNNEIEQISLDHTDQALLISVENKSRKPRLTQHLGVFSDEMTIEPYINKIDYKVGDRFLICSDGLTDMVAIEMISEIMAESEDMRASAKILMAAALEGGGKDNITMIVCGVSDDGAQ